MDRTRNPSEKRGSVNSRNSIYDHKHNPQKRMDKKSQSKPVEKSFGERTKNQKLADDCPRYFVSYRDSCFLFCS